MRQSPVTTTPYRDAFTGRPQAPGAVSRDAVKLLDVRVTAGESGPVVMLSGEADLTTVAELNDALTAQISAGTQLLTVDLSRLRFADSAAIGALLGAARALKTRGGRLELVRPQPSVARTLCLLGVDQTVTIRGNADAGPGQGTRRTLLAGRDHPKCTERLREPGDSPKAG